MGRESIMSQQDDSVVGFIMMFLVVVILGISYLLKGDM